MTDHP